MFRTTFKTWIFPVNLILWYISSLELKSEGRQSSWKWSVPKPAIICVPSPRHFISCAGKRNSACPGSNHHCINTNAHGKEDSRAHTNCMKQEVSDCETGWGRGFCKAREESAVPLPATELGDSALVTTKTVQLVDYSHRDAL